MADVTIINGVDNKGFKRDNFSNVMLEMVTEIKLGNTVERQNMATLNAVLAPFEKVVPRIQGQRLPVKYHNIKFTEGSITAGAKECRDYIDEFILEKSIGYNVQAFDFSVDTLLEYENTGIDPLAEQVDKISAITNAYRNGYLTSHRLIAMMTGSTLRNTIPTYNNGSGKFTTQGGWARGEDYADIITSNVTGDTIRNHYRCIKGTNPTNLSLNDLDDLADSISGTDLFGQGSSGEEGIIALAHPRTIANIAKLVANDGATKDGFIFGTVAYNEISGVKYVGISTFHPDFVLMYDASYGRELILNAVEVSQRQRGLALVAKDKAEVFMVASDLNGAKMRIFPEERYVFNRLSGGIISINKAHAESGGVMTAGGAGEIALNAWIDKIFTRFKY